MESTHRVVFGDARQLNLIKDKSIHLIITSPPYWQLKDYGAENQIGFNDSYESYVNNLNLVWLECFRVLMDGCRLCINIGDQFARSVYYGRYKVIPIRDEIVRFCETIGLDYMGSIIWQKATTCNTTGGATIMGSFPYPRNGIVKLDYEYILLFKKPGTPPKIDERTKEKAAMTTEEWNRYFAGHWYFTGAKQDRHIAMFPEELPKRLIRMFSYEGETVFDPFLGSGTTSLAALRLGRNSIGYEINKDFRNIILEKIHQGNTLLDSAKIMEYEDMIDVDANQPMTKLPYMFHDPVSIDRKVDPKSRTFGSQVSKDSKRAREELCLVKEITSPNTVKVAPDINVRLIGIKPVAGFGAEAEEHLRSLLKGKKVSLKYDAQKYDAQDNLLAYVYLENKTFVNLHYLRSGLVGLDDAMDYAKKERFSREINPK